MDDQLKKLNTIIDNLNDQYREEVNPWSCTIKTGLHSEEGAELSGFIEITISQEGHQVPQTSISMFKQTTQVRNGQLEKAATSAVKKIKTLVKPLLEYNG